MGITSTILLKKYINEKINEVQSGAAPIYGVYWNKGESPALTRTHNAVGLTAAVGIDGAFAQNDFDKAEIFKEMREVTDTLGNVFIRIPKFYIGKTDGVGFKTVQVSKYRYPGFYLPWCFWDFTNQKELPYFDIGKYKASLSVDNKLESKPDKYPLINKNIVEVRGYAKANNTGGLAGYQQLDIHAVDILRTLFFTEFATLNSQAIMQGFTTGRYTVDDKAVAATTNTNTVIVSNTTGAFYRVGQAISVGTTLGGNEVFYGRTITQIQVDLPEADKTTITFDGDPVNIAVDNIMYNTGWKNGFSRNIAASSGVITAANDGKYPCSYRGIESPFGDIWQFVDGVNINEYQAWIAKNAEDYASNLFANSDYEMLGYKNCETSGKWVVAMGYDPAYPFAEFPVTVNGDALKYYSDYYWCNSSQRIARFGGAWDYYGSSAGLSCWALYSLSSDAGVKIGARLTKKAL